MDYISNASNYDYENYVVGPFERANLHRLRLHIMSFTSFMLFGYRGVGKTTFLHRLLDTFRNDRNGRQPYITINCVRAERKPAFLSVLQRELQRAAQLEYPLSKFSCLDSLVNQLNYRYHKRSRDYFAEINEAGGLYCLVECLESMRMSEKFLTTLIEVGREFLPFRMAFVLCTTIVPNMELFQHIEIFSMLKFNFGNPDSAQLKDILKNELKKKEKDFSKHYNNFSNFSEVLTKHIVESVRIVSTRIDHAKEYLELAYDKLMDLNKLELAIKQDQHLKQGKKDSHTTIPIDIHKLFLNPSFREFTSMNLEYGPASETEFQKKRDMTNALMGNIDVKNWDNEYHEQFYVDLLKTSLDMAARCDERDDLKRFTDYKHIGKQGSKAKPLPTENQIKNKKINLFRVLAIADSLESQIIREDEYDQENTDFHSLDYKMCIQSLVRKDKMKVGASGGNFGLGKVNSRVSKYYDLSFLKRNNLNSKQFFES